MQNDFGQFKYTVIADKGTDILEAKILKQNISAEITLKKIQDDIKWLVQKKLEMEAQRKVDRATVQNILDHHPGVAIMDAKLRLAVTMYSTTQEAVTLLDDKLKEIDDMLNQYADEQKEIYLQTGLKVPEAK